MEVPEDCEEDDLPLASRGSVKFWFDLRRDQAPHGATCGADWELNKKTKTKEKDITKKISRLSYDMGGEERGLEWR